MLKHTILKQTRLASLCASAFISINAWAATATESITSYTYHPDGQIHTMDGPRTDVTDVTTHTYHASSGLKHTVTNALGHVTTYETYNAAGQPTKVINPDGLITEMAYHPRGWLEKTSAHTGDITAARVTNYKYDAVGQITKMALPNGAELNYEYDDARRLTAIENGLGERMEYALDAAGNRTREDIKDASGSIVYTVQRAYDELSRVMDVFGNNGQNSNFEYDADDNLVKTYDAQDNTTAFNYDNLNRLKETIEPNTAETGFGYDAQGNLKTVTDARNLTTTYTTNGLGHQTQLQSPDTGTSTFEYDAAGNMIRKIDARGIESLYTYNALNQLLTVTYPAYPKENVTYKYHDGSAQFSSKGQLWTVSTGNTKEEFWYTGYGELFAQLTNSDGAFINSSLYMYSQNGNLEGVRRGTNGNISYQWNEHGQMTGIDYNPFNEFTNNANVTYNIIKNATYAPFGSVNYYEYGNDLSHTIALDNDYNIESIEVGGINPIFEYVYDFNELNQIVGIANNVDSSRDKSYTYHKDGRLWDAYGADGQRRYTYDLVGNRRADAHWDNNGGIIVNNYTYASDSNQLESTTRTDSITTTTATVDYNYTAVGNRQQKTIDGLRNYSEYYTYNAANRLVNFGEDGSPERSYTYNALGQRVVKSFFGASEYYSYDNNGQLATVLDNNRKPIREYIYFNGQAVAMVKFNTAGTSAELFYIHNDHLATPQKITNTSQQVVWAADYEPFGKATVTTSTIYNHTRFPGQFYDSESGLHYNWHRYYDPELGRYITSDPLGLYDGPNTYSYVHGNPINFIDPTGEASVAGPFIGGYRVYRAYRAYRTYQNYQNMSQAAQTALNMAQQGGWAPPHQPGFWNPSHRRDGVEQQVEQLNQSSLGESTTTPWPNKRKKGMWTAICKVVDQSPEECSTQSGKKVGFGYGIAKDKTTARKAAEKMAKDALGSKNVHHPSCKCISPTGVRDPLCR